MNKWFVRFWGFIALASLAALIISTAWAAAPTPAPDAAAVDQEPVDGVFRPPDMPAVLGARLQKASIAAPEERRAAVVLLHRGLNALEVEQLLIRHRLSHAGGTRHLPSSLCL